MASHQKRLLTAPSSKLAKADTVSILRSPAAWESLPFKTREDLYALLPPPPPNSGPHDPDIHPLSTSLKPHIEEELRRFQEDLKDGREGKKWRASALEAGRERLRGEFDEWKEVEREEYWGQLRGVKREGEDEEGKENLGVKDEVADSEGGDEDDEVEVEAKNGVQAEIKDDQGSRFRILSD